MTRGMMIVLGAGAVLLATSSTASAQRWGRERTPRDGACFYEDANFGGNYFCVRAGENLDSLGSGMNDRISSMRIFGRAEVTVYNDRRFGGRSARFENDVRNLRGSEWNDKISSIEVSAPRGRGGRDYGSSRYRGEDPDRIVRRAYQDILNRAPDPEGLRAYRSHIIDDGWTEAQVREELRRSPEYRERSTMTRDRAEDVVRRAYRAVLNREPDPGSRAYVDRVMRDHWTQADVERELRKSPEYRRR